MSLSYFMRESDRKREEAGKTKLQIASAYWKDLENREGAGVVSDGERVAICTFINLKLAGMK